jgi:class 3 adenylate cyclase
MGDLAGAEEAFRQAHDLGVDPQPGLALLYLAQGRRDAALASIRVALAEAGAERTRRARLLPAQVDIALEARDMEAAAGAAEELSAIASEFGTPALHAAAHLARGAVLVTTGRPADAVPELVRARGHWQEVEAPYEVAQARVWLGRAHREAGTPEEAALELEAARSTFERLGAGPDAERSRRLLAELHEGDRGRRVRRTFLFTDIVDSTRLIGVIGDEAWGDVRRWHDQTIRSLVARHGGEEVKATGDGFFLAFPDPRSAVDCAVAIQRALAEHRRSAGFAPRVRIGGHSAEATRAGDDYLGQGVHLAARVAAVAGGGEILVTPETLARGIDHPVGGPRPVELKGIPGTVEVRAVEWSPPP